MVEKEINTTIVYYTDNSLQNDIFEFCQDNIFKVAEGKPIISVSQKPIKFGKNICVGDIGRSHLSLFKQILAGIEQVTTQYIALAEHDCLYVSEHFNWIPPQDDIFYYNVNHWFVDWKTGMYSFHRRKVLSMMIANTQIALKAAREKVELLTLGAKIKKGQAGACEFGVCDNRDAYEDLIDNVKKDFGKDIGKYCAAPFKTVNPCLDIRHKGNFSGGRRGEKRCYEIPFWGRFHETNS